MFATKFQNHFKAPILIKCFWMQNKDVNVGDDFLLTAKAGKTGIIKIKKDNNIGKLLMREINRGRKIKLKI